MAIRNGEIQGNKAPQMTQVSVWNDPSAPALVGATCGALRLACGSILLEAFTPGGGGLRSLNADELQALEQLKAGHVGEIRSLDTLAESLPSLQGVGS